MTLNHPLAFNDLLPVALEAARVGICVTDEPGRFVNVNAAFCEMSGWREGELVGMNADRVGIPGGTAGEHAAHGGLPAGSIGDPEGELKIRRKDGGEFWALVAGTPTASGAGAQGTVWVVRDVTRRKRLEEGLRRTLTERELILKSTLVGITLAANRRVLWVNDTFARMLGYEREELIGEPTVLHFPDRESYEAFREEAHRSLTTGRPHTTEQRMKRKDGSLIWCQLNGHALDPGDVPKGSIWTNIDITERKRAEEEVLRALERERELNDLKTRFVAMTSHEFRTPLSAILSSSELLERFDERLGRGERLDILRDVKSAVLRMSAMLDQVLLIGKADSGQIAFEPVPVNLRELCRKVLEEIRVMLGARHELRYACTGNCERVAVDERLVRHILGNLLSNAVKYSPEGGPVMLNVTREGDAAVITVTDAGLGIPAADRARLFESFHRGRNVGHIPGTGLGLAIVKKSVEQHGGRIDVESEVGRGTRFTVTLPLGGVANDS